MKTFTHIRLISTIVLAVLIFQCPVCNASGNPKTLKEALSELEQHFKVSILYDSELIANKKTRSTNEKYKTIEESLTSILKGHRLDFKKAGSNFYYIIPRNKKDTSETTNENLNHEPVANASENTNNSSDEPEKDNVTSEERLFSGTVTDAESGEPLPGVNVLIKGTSSGTSTDATGKFEIGTANENIVLVISFVGYMTREIMPDPKTSLIVALKPDIKVLSEAIVVGYGTQERKDLTGSLSVIKSNDIEKMPVASFEQALQGQASGVFVSSNSGAPGSDVTVRIRGTGTIGNNNPLYVIDGTPTGPESLNLFNPRDIESIVILKDAAAATIYGSRAANGVILVTTKKGKAGETKVSFDSYYGLQSAWCLPQLLNVSQYATIINEAYTNAGKPARFGQPDTLGENHYWLREMFRTAATQNYNLSISGGSDKSRFSVSGSYLKQNGILPNSDFNRLSFRVNTSYQLKKKWNAGQNLTISHSNGNQVRTNELGGILSNAVYKRPFDAVYDDDGKYAESALDPNPIAQAMRTENRRGRLRLFGNIFAEYDLNPALQFRTNFGMDINYSKNKNYVPAFGATPISLVEYSDLSYTPLWQNSLSFNKKWSNHEVSAVVSVDAQSSRYEFTTVKVDNFITDEANNRYISAAQNVDIGRIDGNATEWSLLSFVSRINYTFKDRYLFSASFRRDGTSRFAVGHQ